MHACSASKQRACPDIIIQTPVRGIDQGDDITSSHNTLKCVGHTKTALGHYNNSVLALQKALKVMTMRMLFLEIE